MCISAILVHLLALSQYLLLKYQYLLGITNVGLDVVFGGIVLVYMVLIYCILAEFENEVLQNRPLTLYGIEIRIYKMISIALTVLSVVIIGYQGGKFVLTQSMESLQEVSFFTNLILLGSATLASYLNYRKTNEKAGRKLFRIYVMIWEAIGVMILGLIILYAIAYSILPVGM